MVAKRVRVLVVDDYGAWRSLLSSTLGRQPGLSVVGEAADGPEALRKISDLLPELILLDIGLPEMNGLEVASRAREISPNSKILIVSQTHSVDVAEEALRRGALGYVLKSSAVAELLPAVRAVLQGTQFISPQLNKLIDRSGKQAVSSPRNKNVNSPSLSPNSENGPGTRSNSLRGTQPLKPG